MNIYSNWIIIQRWLYFIMSVFIITIENVDGNYLFRASPGGDGNKPAGLWGGSLHLEHNGQGSNLFTHGYESLNTSYTTYYGIEMEYISHDPISNRVLMIIEDPDSSPTSIKQSMAFGPLCQDGCASLEATFQNFQLVDDTNPYFMDRDCGWKCGWGPFAYYNNQIFFVLSAVFGSDYSSLTRQIQIRMLVGCDDVIDSIKNRGQSSLDQVAQFPILQCSVLINVVHRELYVKPNPKPKVWTTKDLRIILPSKETDVHFLMQIVDATTPSSPKMTLTHIYDSQKYELHSESIGVIYTGNNKLRGLGSLDYRNGYLCWTAAENLYCTAYNLNGEQIYPKVVMSGEDAIKNGLCHTSNLPQHELQRTLTGVAISDTDTTLSVYFGCYADAPATGGIGLIRMKNHGLTKELYQVKSGSHKVFGGALFIAETVDNGCNYDGLEACSMTSTGSNIQTISTTNELNTVGNVICGDLPLLSACAKTHVSIIMVVLTFMLVLCIISINH